MFACVLLYVRTYACNCVSVHEYMCSPVFKAEKSCAPKIMGLLTIQKISICNKQTAHSLQKPSGQWHADLLNSSEYNSLNSLTDGAFLRRRRIFFSPADASHTYNECPFVWILWAVKKKKKCVYLQEADI